MVRGADLPGKPGYAISEREFQQTVIEYATLLGWTVWHTPDSRATNAGEPDLRLLRPPRVIFAELKSQRGSVKATQRAAIAALGQCEGVEVYLWRPGDWDAIVRVLGGDAVL